MKQLNGIMALLFTILHTFIINGVHCGDDDTYLFGNHRGGKKKRKASKEEIIAVYSVVIGTFICLMVAYLIWWKCCQKDNSQIHDIEVPPPSEKNKY